MSAPLNSNSPLVPPIEDAKQGIQTFAMYYYQSLLEAGFNSQAAKNQVADLLEKQYYRFCEQGDIAPKNLGTIEMKLMKTVKAVEAMAKNDPSLRSVYNDLVSIQNQMKR